MDLRIESVALTHQGCVRTNNEDSLLERQAAGLWVVADGMGGHEHGEWASGEIASQLGRISVPYDFDAACHAVAGAIHAANAVVFEESEKRGQQMGSTVVALHISGRQFAIFWVGDSRIYLMRGGELIRLTKDHTQVQEMVDRGLLSDQEAADHPMGHMLARAVGVQAQVEVDVIIDEVEAGDIFLLCSDGLTGPVGDDDIAAILNAGAQVPAAQKLVEVTLERGAPDNVTVAVVTVSEATSLSFIPGADRVL